MTVKQNRVRSPAYPAVSLKSALRKVSEFYKVEGRNEAFQSVALTHWGYSPTSGSGLKLAAALASYGLIDASGSGKNRKVKLSQIALKILLDDRENASEKKQCIQSIALKPKMNQKLWNLWGEDLPSNATMRHHLIFEEGFNEKSVASFIKDYRETIEFAELIGVDSSDEGNAQNENDSEDLDGIESQTVHSSDERATSHDSQAPSQYRETLNQSSGESEIGKFPVGKNCTIRLISSGNINRKTIEALVAQLKLNLELGVFDDELDS